MRLRIDCFKVGLIMTATVSNLLKLITDMGYPITIAANLITKSPDSVGALTRAEKNNLR